MQDKHGLATGLKIVNVVTFAIISLIWQIKLGNLSTEQQYMLQATAAVVTLFLIMLLFPLKGGGSRLSKVSQRFKVYSFKTYFYRAICNGIGVPVWMEALKLISANEAMAITYLSPALTALLAVLFLKEQVKLSWIIALMLGFCGIFLMLYYGAEQTVQMSMQYKKGIFLAVCASIAFSIYNLICKHQTNVKDDYFAQAFYTFALATLISLPMGIATWKGITLEETLWALGSGVIGVLSVVTLYLSYQFSSVVRMAPHSYFRIITTTIALYLLKDELPTAITIIAIGLILLGNSCVVFENTFYKLLGRKNRAVN